MDPPRLFIDELREGIDISSLEFVIGPVVEDFRRKVMAFGKLFQNLHIRRKTGLCFFAWLQPQNIEENAAKLFRRIDIEFLSREAVYLRLKYIELSLEFFRKFIEPL